MGAVEQIFGDHIPEIDMQYLPRRAEERALALIGIVGAAAGSMFVFKGPYRAVLINYPRISFDEPDL